MRSIALMLCLGLSPMLCAEEPTSYYCNGTVQRLAGKWFERGHALTGVDGATPLGQAPSACPPHAAGMAAWAAFSHGLNELSAEGAKPGAPPLQVLAYHVGPKVQSFGTLGLLLGRTFIGSGYSPSSALMSTELVRIESRAQSIADTLLANYSSVQLQVPTSVAQINREREINQDQLRALEQTAQTAVSDLRASLSAVVGKSKPPLPERLSLLMPGMHEATIRSELAIPRENLRPNGADLLGLLQTERERAYQSGAIQQRIQAEYAKNAAAEKRLLVSDERITRGRTALELAEKFAAADTPAANDVASALVREAQNARYEAVGWSGISWTAAQRADGTTVVSDSVGSEMEFGIIEAVERFEATQLVSRTLQQAAAAHLSSAQMPTDEAAFRHAAFSSGSQLLDRVRAVFYGGDLHVGLGTQAVAVTLLDVALGITPVVGWSKDLVEAVSGLHLLTGEELGLEDRGFAILGAVTLGFGSKLKVSKVALTRTIEFITPLMAKLDGFIAAKKWLAAKYAFYSVDAFEIVRGYPIPNVSGFATATSLKNHLNHASELGLSADEYVNAAVQFGKSTADSHWAFRRPSSGDYVKWNPFTKEFAVYDASGRTITYFRKEGNDFEYFLKQYSRENPRDITL